jgi:hypothetical protein
VPVVVEVFSFWEELNYWSAGFVSVNIVERNPKNLQIRRAFVDDVRIIFHTEFIYVHVLSPCQISEACL